MTGKNPAQNDMQMLDLELMSLAEVDEMMTAWTHAQKYKSTTNLTLADYFSVL